MAGKEGTVMAAGGDKVTNMEEIEPLVEPPSQLHYPYNKGDGDGDDREGSSPSGGGSVSSSPHGLPHVGLFLTFMSAFCYSVSSVCVKLLVDVNLTELTMIRMASLLLLSLPLQVCSSGHIFPKGHRCLLVLRGVLGTSSVALQYYAFLHLPLADASVIIFSGPVFVSILAKVFLGEPCGILRSGVILMTVVGIFLIARPPFLFGSLSGPYTAENWWGMAAAVLGTVIVAIVYVVLRMLKGVHYSTVTFTSSIIPFFVTFFVAYLNGDLCMPKCGKDRYLIVLLNVISFADQLLFIKALQLEEAGPVSVMRASAVVFAFIWQAVFFHKAPDGLDLVGALMVTGGVVILGLQKRILSER